MTRLHQIVFRVDTGQSADGPNVTVLVDGEDLIGAATGFKGLDPDQIFGGDDPLVPRDPPRRVAIYRCSCGEPGCGCVAMVISRTGDVVRWQDARDFVGVYARPTVARDPAGGYRLDVPDLGFDADQYRAELERAGADRTWETQRR